MGEVLGMAGGVLWGILGTSASPRLRVITFSLYPRSNKKA